MEIYWILKESIKQQKQLDNKVSIFCHKRTLNVGSLKNKNKI